MGERLGAIEQAVAADPEGCFRFDAEGTATLVAGERSHCAGRFAIPSIGELRARLAGRRAARAGRLRLSVLHGAHMLSDIGTLQATASAGTLFQVASQFNCLEAPGPYVVPVRNYVHDSTQGPRASVSAFPGTFLRHYRAPRASGERFVQTDRDQLNLLADAFDASVAEVRSGYLQTSNVHAPDKLAAQLSDRFDAIRVGVQDEVEVVFGHDWGGPVPGAPHQRTAQVFTSTMALGGYSHSDGSPAIATACRQLLRAAYLGTLLAAIDLGKHTVVLTMIGGGVFGNAHSNIWEAIHWALSEAEPLADGPLDVLVNTRESLADAERERVRQRGGVVVELGAERITIVR